MQNYTRKGKKSMIKKEYVSSNLDYANVYQRFAVVTSVVTFQGIYIL